MIGLKPRYLAKTYQYLLALSQQLINQILGDGSALLDTPFL
jgi:hypothetical protein